MYSLEKAFSNCQKTSINRSVEDFTLNKAAGCQVSILLKVNSVTDIFLEILKIFETATLKNNCVKVSRIDQVKFVEDSLSKFEVIWSA